MAISYNGKTPGRFWYFRQRCRAMVHAFKDSGIKTKARAMRRNALMSGGSIAAGVALTMKYAALLPIIASFGPPAAGAAGIFFGWRGWRNYRAISKSVYMHTEIRKAETAWLDKQARPKLHKRAGAWLQGMTAKLGRAAATPFKIFRRKNKPADTLQETPAIPAADTQALPASAAEAEAAPAFDAAAQRPAEDPQRAEAARRRAAARARRKDASGKRFR